MPHTSQADQARSNRWYYRIVFGIVFVSLAYSFWQIYERQAKLNHDLDESNQELRKEKLRYENESSELVGRIAGRVEMGMPIHPVVSMPKGDDELNQKLMPILLANLKDRRSAVVDCALDDLKTVLVGEPNPDRWKTDLQPVLLPMLSYGTHDLELVELLLLVGVSADVIRSRLLERVDFDDVNTVLHAGKVMQRSDSDLDPIPLYVDYLRQRDDKAMAIVREIEMDAVSGYDMSMKDRFSRALRMELLEAETPQQQARLRVWIDYVKDPTTLPDKYRPLDDFDQVPFSFLP